MRRWLQKFARAARTQGGRPAHLGPRQLYIFPTGAGFLYGAALFVMLIGSLNYGSNLGLLFTFLFAATGLVTLLHTWRNLLHIELSAAGAAPLFVGGEADFPVRLRDATGREHPALEVGTLDGPSASVLLPAGSEVATRLRLPATHRGRLALGRLKVASRFPLGLLRAWAYADMDAAALVYPRPGAAEPLGLHSAYTRSEKGDRGMGADDFIGPRRYRPGDPPRHLDWKAFARERGLVTRQFGGDRAEQLWLDWNRLPPGDTEQRLSRLCRMVLDAEEQGLSYGLRLPERQVEPAAGDAHKHRCLEALALFEFPEAGDAAKG